jgi:NAD+ synthase (glutamine-hydrolysing)
LARLAIDFGVAELGVERFVERLNVGKLLADAKTSDAIARALLLCVYQSTRNSSTTTLNAAQSAADEIGAEFMQLDVEPLAAGYVDLISKALGRTLDWSTDDLALQNIQARTRSPSVWLLANLRGALLLATSNRSEAAVGYTTMDGDTSGGLSPIAGIDKAFLREWLAWMETDGPTLLAPLSALAAVNRQQPTAELRPAAQGQTDEADLMPYPLLDAVERSAIRDKLPPVDVFKRMQRDFPQYTVDQLVGWIERFFTLWCRNQWKRERYAPSFHLDDENLDPKTWCRFPILSGGYERELAEMRAYAATLA